MELRQSTARTIPVVGGYDVTDGITPETGVTLGAGVAEARAVACSVGEDPAFDVAVAVGGGDASSKLMSSR